MLGARCRRHELFFTFCFVMTLLLHVPRPSHPATLPCHIAHIHPHPAVPLPHRRVIVVFDLYDRRSFDSVKGWLKQVDKYGRQGVCKILVGNKSDLDFRSAQRGNVPPAGLFDEAQRFAQRRGLRFVTTSAKSDAGIDFCFVSLLDEMYSRRDPGRFPPLRPLGRGGGALRCVECCLPRPVKRLGPDEFVLSARERERAPSRGRARPPPGKGCAVM